MRLIYVLLVWLLPVTALAQGAAPAPETWQESAQKLLLSVAALVVSGIGAWIGKFVVAFLKAKLLTEKSTEAAATMQAAVAALEELAHHTKTAVTNVEATIVSPARLDAADGTPPGQISAETAARAKSTATHYVTRTLSLPAQKVLEKVYSPDAFAGLTDATVEAAVTQQKNGGHGPAAPSGEPAP